MQGTAETWFPPQLDRRCLADPDINRDRAAPLSAHVSCHGSGIQKRT
jgi:hypothetical protein